MSASSHFISTWHWIGILLVQKWRFTQNLKVKCDCDSSFTTQTTIFDLSHTLCTAIWNSHLACFHWDTEVIHPHTLPVRSLDTQREFLSGSYVQWIYKLITLINMNQMPLHLQLCNPSSGHEQILKQQSTS